MNDVKFKKELLIDKNTQDIHISVKNLHIFSNQSKLFKYHEESDKLFLSKDLNKFVFESIL